MRIIDNGVGSSVTKTENFKVNDNKLYYSYGTKYFTIINPISFEKIVHPLPMPKSLCTCTTLFCILNHSHKLFFFSAWDAWLDLFL